ncbi:acyl-CoA thioesterase [Neorhodopirellula pilleata]|uniref:Acyl-ACP thioesterase n=1 Tax=Neorhodopirellula pilleata TaxID=2714738 RepID=A0A5C6ASR0_9BACT|nr:acyl-CoA thioesterase [Neorhodopirellula pilleata]TWU02022.1 Acyl-ACP thioesterase [Neorhodopirellula pilleata]
MNDAWFDFHHTVTIDEVDAQQHVHNLRYLQWTLWAARDHNAAIGWDAQAALEAGFGWVVRDHEITYRVAAVAHDEIVVRTWISQTNRYACVRNAMIYRPSDKRLLSKASTRWVYIDLKRHRALEVPKLAIEGYQICEKIPPAPW